MNSVLVSNKKLKLAFVGVGWIGKNRMDAIINSNLADVKAIADLSDDNIKMAQKGVSEVFTCSDIEDLFHLDLDGVVIATPSALHAEQTIKALENDLSVFCQKPLGRTREEAELIINTAKNKNKLLGVDFSYRHTCYNKIFDLVKNGDLGKIYSFELVFHNAYGPDKSWFYNPELSGGGALIDLGVHLVDLALWTLDYPSINNVCSKLYKDGNLLTGIDQQVEDYAVALLDTDQGASIEIACSWNLPAGKEADIQVNIYGTQGGAAFRNLNGSFYDFEALKFNGTQTEVLFSGKDEWGGRAAVEWSRKLAEKNEYDPEIESTLKVAGLIDRIYGR